MKKIREWIKDNEERALFVGILLLFFSILGVVHNYHSPLVNGISEAKKERRIIECVFGGKLIKYEEWEDEQLDENGVLSIQLDYHKQVVVQYINTPCRKIRNRYLNGKKWGVR